MASRGSIFRRALGSGAARTAVILLAACIAAAPIAGCRSGRVRSQPAPRGTEKVAELPDAAYRVDPDLETWIDPETGYDTTREWRLDGGTWPIAMLMSPSQSPQAIVADRDGLFSAALLDHGITPVIEPIDLPPRTFHALQRSKWPFVYMPLAVFTDYSRGNENQGDAGGLQYVALAGSTAGGGYTLLSKDPSVRTVADLAGKTVAQVNSNPVPAVLLVSAAKQAGLAVGDGPGDIRLMRTQGGNLLDEYEAGEIDALISLNITKAPLMERGSHAVTDFSDVEYTPNYTVLCVERSVLEERPEVVTAFLEAHYAANRAALAEWDKGLKSELMESWNAYYSTQGGDVSAQRIVKTQQAFDLMLGDMYPEQRIDPVLLGDCWEYVTEQSLWGWNGRVDPARLSALEHYDDVLDAHGEEPQAAAHR